MSHPDDEIYSYDLVPYRSWPYAQSHPDRMASIAKLLGLKPQPIHEARVLELACAAGGNIIPIAEAYPESQFVGIDLSARELAEGVDTVKKLGLANTQLRHMDITEINHDLGKFHYIIAHGVYSWVREEVREKILQICSENLSFNGVAYISYNTYPGWRMRSMIRDMLVYHAKQFDEPEKQIEQARALLNFLVESVSTKNDPYGAFLKQELHIFDQVRDDYLFHDHLSGVNEPVYFHEFVGEAERHRLKYLGETDLKSMATSSFSSKIETTLQRISKDTIQIEQYMDFLRNRSFRQTLLCHQHHTIDRSLAPEHVRDLYFATPLKPVVPEHDVGSEDVLRFSNEKLGVETADPLIKAALLCLSEAWPRWIHFPELVQQAGSLLAHSKHDVDSRKDNDARCLGEHLIRLYASSAVEIHADAPHFTSEISDRPVTTALARLQAESARRVTNRRHEIVNLDEAACYTLRCLDGVHDRPAILDHLRTLVDQKKLVVEENDHAITDDQRLGQILGEMLENTLQQLVGAAMLIR